MAKIKVRQGESLEQALRRFNKAVLKSGIMKELKERERFKKKSELRTERRKQKLRKQYLENKRNRF